MTPLLRAAGAFLIPALTLLGAPAHAQESFRIGFVNPDRVLREAQPAKAAQAKLEAEFLKREKDLQVQGDALKTASEKFEREAPTIAESQRAQRQRQLVDQDRDFQRRRREFQEDLNARKNEELQQVYERANRVVKQVAEAEKYDAILQEAIYINPKHDITEKVIKALNASNGVTSAPSAPSTTSAPTAAGGK
jgi:outer membrane protein